MNKKNIAIHVIFTLFFFNFLTTKSVKMTDIKFLVFVIIILNIFKDFGTQLLVTQDNQKSNISTHFFAIFLL